MIKIATKDTPEGKKEIEENSIIQKIAIEKIIKKEEKEEKEPGNNTFFLLSKSELDHCIQSLYLAILIKHISLFYITRI